jgi:hypothetical protein
LGYQGWEFGAQGTRQAQAGDKGGAANDPTASASPPRSINSENNSKKSGLMAQATVAGTKFWKDKTLN